VVDTSERDYVQALSIQHKVTLQILTNLNAEELAVEYNKARLCVYAPVLEPFGLVPLEAMSCGTPVVGVREGGVQESIIDEHTGLLVERDPEKFAQAIQRLLSDPGLADEYGRNGREHVLKNWTWEQSVGSLENIYLPVQMLLVISSVNLGSSKLLQSS
jgi:glycosyltransferase involved in cell wall biosynthesis